MCKNEQPNNDDFKTHYELGTIPEGKDCEAMALSFFSTKQKACRMQNIIKKFKSYSVIPIEIKKEHGIGILENEHLNLWEYSGNSFIDGGTTCLLYTSPSPRD